MREREIPEVGTIPSASCTEEGEKEEGRAEAVRTEEGVALR